MLATNNNVLVVGSGPIGSTYACVLKAINCNSKITVIDKRPDPRRNHGLSIDSHSISKIKVLLQQSLTHLSINGNSNADQIRSLKTILDKWSNHFVRTNEIEITVAEQAKKMGIQILRDPSYEIAKGDLNLILGSNGPTVLTEKQTKLQHLFNAASVIIGADGAHSTIREELGIKLVEEQTLRHMVEIKFQTDGQTRSRGYIEASLLSCKTGHVAFESINKAEAIEKKPGTLLVFTDQNVYDKLRQIDGKGNLKGVAGNAWTLTEINRLGKSDKKIQSLYTTLDTYFQSLKKRGGKYTDEKIVTLELKIYRAEKSVKTLHGKHFLLIGDANSGLVLQRGFNKGLNEVALCAKAVDQFFKHQAVAKTRTQEVNTPQVFLDYEKATQNLFNKEKSGNLRKNKAIKVAQSTVTSTATSVDSVKYMSKMSSKSSKNLSESTVKSTTGIFSFVTKAVSWLFRN